jgi:hypothetical protein
VWTILQILIKGQLPAPGLARIRICKVVFGEDPGEAEDGSPGIVGIGHTVLLAPHLIQLGHYFNSYGDKITIFL